MERIRIKWNRDGSVAAVSFRAPLEEGAKIIRSIFGSAPEPENARAWKDFTAMQKHCGEYGDYLTPSCRQDGDEIVFISGASQREVRYCPSKGQWRIDFRASELVRELFRRFLVGRLNDRDQSRFERLL